ncbi:hypothetical protein HPP92_009981 [Vanilla planifolia]|uniref:Uncharacterized protein n=1 Tax=Vanilla planifolia TaxID=51239 RepID=A0A835V594_VANPL|nr:hypothetical protein HPP92_009981 [Vanilla planifolia]
MHVLRGHRGEVICCSVNSDIGIVASSSSSSGVLLHSLRRGRLLRKLDNLEARALCISSTGALLIWNDLEKKLCTYYINGTHIATAILSPFSGQISCIEISADGQYALIGSSSCRDGQYPLVGSSSRKHDEANGESSIKANLSESSSSNKIFLRSYSNKPTENRLFIPIPSICFLNLLSLKVFHTLTLGEGQDVTSFALSKDNKNLLVSTADSKLIVFTDPSLSLKKIEGDDTLKS